MLPSPYDEVVEHIVKERYHNHRRESHSDLISRRIVHDLGERCPAFRDDRAAGVIDCWLNVSAPGGRQRFLDLFVGEPDPSSGGPDFRRLRIGVEHKSVITAHRNNTNRYDDLQRTLGAIHPERPQAVLAATVLIGTARRVLNVPDYVHKMRPDDFEEAVLPRLSSGDLSLWTEFPIAVSKNRKDDAMKTVRLFQSIPTRSPGHTHVMGYDYIQLVPVHIDNVEPPRVERDNTLGLDVDGEYRKMIHTLCAAYTARWHL